MSVLVGPVVGFRRELSKAEAEELKARLEMAPRDVRPAPSSSDREGEWVWFDGTREPVMCNEAGLALCGVEAALRASVALVARLQAEAIDRASSTEWGWTGGSGPWDRPVPRLEYAGGDSAHEYWVAIVDDVEVGELHFNGEHAWFCDAVGNDLSNWLGAVYFPTTPTPFLSPVRRAMLDQKYAEQMATACEELGDLEGATWWRARPGRGDPDHPQD